MASLRSGSACSSLRRRSAPPGLRVPWPRGASRRGRAVVPARRYAAAVGLPRPRARARRSRARARCAALVRREGAQLSLGGARGKPLVRIAPKTGPGDDLRVAAAARGEPQRPPLSDRDRRRRLPRVLVSSATGRVLLTLTWLEFSYCSSCSVGNGPLTVANSSSTTTRTDLLTGGADAASLSGMNLWGSATRKSAITAGRPPTPLRLRPQRLCRPADATDDHRQPHPPTPRAAMKSRARRWPARSPATSSRTTRHRRATASISVGGNNVVSGNTIEKGANAGNKYVIHFGDTTASYPGSKLVMNGNTIHQ